MNIAADRIPELKEMKKRPSSLDYRGDLALLESLKVSIVGSRKPTKYSRSMTQQLASALGRAGVVVVSGGAMGIDAVAHMGAKSSCTIAVLPCGIDIQYPAVNKNLLLDIAKEGLVLSQFEEGFRATPWSFVLRNELVVALGEVLIVGEAELESGSMRSIEFAQKMQKEIYVFPQRLGESSATNRLLLEGGAKAIFDIDLFVQELLQKYAKNPLFSPKVSEKKEDPFFEFCKKIPSYEELLQAFPTRVFEAELAGEISIKNGKVYLEN